MGFQLIYVIFSHFFAYNRYLQAKHLFLIKIRLGKEYLTFTSPCMLLKNKRNITEVRNDFLIMETPGVELYGRSRHFFLVRRLTAVSSHNCSKPDDFVLRSNPLQSIYLYFQLTNNTFDFQFSFSFYE